MDGLDLSLLKLVADIIAKPLTHIFNLSLEQNIPESWKTANVTPLFKSGDLTLLDNYRPTSKLSVLAKIFEALVRDQLEYLAFNSILTPFSVGFQEGP